MVDELGLPAPAPLDVGVGGFGISLLSSCRDWHRDAVRVHAGVPLLQRDHRLDLLLPGELLPEPPALVLRRSS